MLRLPPFRLHTPARLAEAAAILAAEGAGAALLAGGTDLLPNMKRGQQQPRTLIALRRIESLQQISAAGTGAVDDDAGGSEGTGLTLGAGLTLSRLAENPLIRERYAGLWQAARLVATPQLRNMGTLGGNLCLDTRCNFYNRSESWRQAINYCLKKDGESCWAVTRSKQCRAVSSTDTAPALMALGARVRLMSAGGERLLALADFYRNDGIDYLARRPDEILTDIVLDSADGWRSTYWKLRRRGSFDFPLLSVAASVRSNGSGTVEQARVILGAVDSQPLTCMDVADFLVSRKLTDDVIEEAGRIAMPFARPVNYTDLEPLWRKKMVPVFLGHALRELRGDDVRELRLRTMQW
jgi:4-hydroxybenzoyl-CoA reductase subunit beta